MATSHAKGELKSVFVMMTLEAAPLERSSFCSLQVWIASAALADRAHPPLRNLPPDRRSSRRPPKKGFADGAIIYAFGSDNVKTAPKPELAFALISPRCAATIRRQMESPSPMPSFLVV
jgi:hypothetical protein